MRAGGIDASRERQARLTPHASADGRPRRAAAHGWSGAKNLREPRGDRPTILVAAPHCWFGRIAPSAGLQNMRPQFWRLIMRVGAITSLACAIALAGCAGPAGNVSVLQGDTAIAAGSQVA